MFLFNEIACNNLVIHKKKLNEYTHALFLNTIFLIDSSQGAYSEIKRNVKANTYTDTQAVFIVFQ